MGQVERKPLEDNAAQQQRAQQQRKRDQVEKKNPFSRDNKEARRAEFLNKLRQERGVAEPQKQEARHDEVGAAAGSGDVSGRAAESDRKPSDSVSPQNDVKGEASQNTAKDETPEWYKRQQELVAMERRATEASAAVERQRVEAEKAKADADAAVQRMAAAKEDPVQFLAEAGMTQDEWSQFLANGGKMTPEQKKLKEMASVVEQVQAKLEAAERKAEQQEQRARAAAEESHFAQQLQKFTYVPEMGGIGAVRERQRLLASQTGQPVSLSDAADHLEQDMAKGLKRILQNTKIRSSLGLDVNTSHAGQAAETPRTLSNRVSSESSQQDASPHPLDWAAKRKLYQQRVERERAARSGR